MKHKIVKVLGTFVAQQIQSTCFEISEKRTNEETYIVSITICNEIKNEIQVATKFQVDTKVPTYIEKKKQENVEAATRTRPRTGFSSSKNKNWE